MTIYLSTDDPPFEAGWKARKDYIENGRNDPCPYCYKKALNHMNNPDCREYMRGIMSHGRGSPL